MTLRVLVDQSGYDLLNLGDVAMLQACVRRLRDLRPDATIAVFCHDAGRLAKYCPDAIPVPAAPAWLPRSGRRRRLGVAAAQAWKIVAPYAIRRPKVVTGGSAPTGWREAIKWADVVVSSGGGFLNDTWWWHGSGVLSVLAAAQRLGKPTAMFGQGLGPLSHPALRRQAAHVLPRLTLLGLRGAVSGEPLVRELGVPSSVVVVTGDDGLEIIDLDSTPESGDVVGVNVRVASYSGVDDESTAAVGAGVSGFVAEHDASALVLPVSLFAGFSDAGATERMLAGRLATPLASAGDVSDPAELAEVVARCRIVVTGSYHAAVFALARGVPVVGLSRSDYYDAKFADLAGLFSDAVSVVQLASAQTTQQLKAAMDAAWAVAPDARKRTRDRAREQKASGRAAYALFLNRAERLSG
ncbi:MAG TPA: polysaccharide pyruvyl transferase family protein [Mycobacteriales bacterium]|nr:polysaccharide pyruvyl transferase family protein [Mycobacteriales bacterium]HVX69962.1 polysaccharide pyruvyl transferase family protein [Mycobacteriales bacterium]